VDGGEIAMVKTWWKRVSPEAGWSTFWLVAIVVMAATWSTVRADWADGLDVLPGIAAAGLFIGLVLSEWRRLPIWLSHLVMVLIGVVVILWRMSRQLSDELGGWSDKLWFLWTRWAQWFSAIRQGERAEDLYLFILLMAAIHYLIAYCATWLVLRRRHPWLSVLLPGIVLLTNLGYSRKVSIAYLLLYLFAAMVLVGRVNLAAREWSWRRLGVPYSGTIAWQAMWVLTYLAIAVMIGGWLVPLTIHSERAAAAWQQVDGPWERARDTLAQWFPSVRGPGGRGVGGFASFGSSFQLGGPLRLSDEPVLLVTGESAPYLVAHRYNIFTGQGWQTDLDPANQSDSPSPAQSSGFVDGPLVELRADEPLPSMAWSSESRVEQRFAVEVIQPRSAVIFTTGQPVSVSRPVRAQMSWFDNGGAMIDVQQVELDAVPPELRPLVELLKKADFTPPQPTPSPAPEASGPATPAPTPEGAQQATPPPGSESTPTPQEEQPEYGSPPELPQIQALLRQLRQRGIEASYHIDKEGGYRVKYLWYSGPLPVYDDVEALFAQDAVRQGFRYEVVSSVSVAMPEQLRQAAQTATQLYAGEDDPFMPWQSVTATEYGVYPEPIYQRYTQLPPVVSARTVELAHSLAAGKTNAYDVAEAIESYLRSHITYNENIAQPRVLDVVDYILFERPEGYCTYYATAMIVLLRILGIPSRMVVGYYPADYDEQAGGFLYRDRNAHAWVEVYFPGYGWIPFEPTAARSPIPRGVVPGIEGLSGSTESGSLQPPFPTDGRRLDFPEDFGPPEGAGGVGTFGPAPEQATPRWMIALRGLSLVLSLLVAAALGAWFWGTRGLSPVGQLMLKVQRASRLSGLPYESTMTPYELAAVVGRAFPGTRHHAWLLADLYTRERYGGRPPTPAEVEQAQRAWRQLRGRFVRQLLRARLRVGPPEVTPGQ
jgi:transglutaminase-like putative cysteine protease